VATFGSVVLDVDSTLTRVEGIAWLAQRKGGDVMRRVASMTERAMDGTVPLDEVYGMRLALVQPSRSDVAALAAAYARGIVRGARKTLARLRADGVHLTVVSGGLRQAVAPFAESLGFADGQIHAVSVEFSADGCYAGFDDTSPLTRRGGKPAVVRGLDLPRPVLALGDGSTDAELRRDPAGGTPAVDAFAAFVGVAERPTVVAVADYVVRHFDELPMVVHGELPLVTHRGIQP